MSKKHSPKSLAEAIRRFYEEEGYRPSSNQFSRSTGVSSSTISRHGGWNKLVETALGAQSLRDEQAIREHELKRKARQKRGELQAIIKNLEIRNSELEETVNHLLSSKEVLEGWTPDPIKVSSKKRRLPEATYVMLASDWHVGERVRPEQIGFRNEYTPEIAQERALQFWRSNLKMLNAARAAWNIDEAVLWIGGDLITGFIHEEYEAENFLSPIEETTLAFRMMVEGIQFVLDKYDLKRVVIPTSNGNHGRTGKKRISGDFRNSYEYMLYLLLAEHFKKEPRAQFQIGNGYYSVLSVYDMEVRFHHGDAIRSMGGVGGLAPPLYRRLGRQPDVLIDCSGHHHVLDFLRKMCKNGSLIGWNMFAEYMGCEYEEPQQASFVIDSKHKIACNFNPIIVR